MAMSHKVYSSSGSAFRHNPVATIKTCHILHSATLLSTEMGPLEHDYIEIIDMIYSSHPNLGSEPLPNAKEEWFTDRRDSMRERKKAGEICSHLPGPSHRGTKPTVTDFCPKSGADREP